ncbi:MAG: hypothetical protein GF381_01475 [Candidatus Pacebacteria bacterium]|nr:hypothetical protein [Candidatus Paceibacterota bacterium]
MTDRSTNDINNFYQRIKGKTFDDAINRFKELDIGRGDSFFEAFGVGNALNKISRPHERFLCYEHLLKHLEKTNKMKFKKIHKGTPYYFMAWLSLDLMRCKRALFYIDAAIAEDIRKADGNIEEALQTPVGHMLRLKVGNQNLEIFPGYRATQILRDIFKKELDDFRNRTGIKVSLDCLVHNFVVKILKQNKKNRSLLSSFYTFILENKQILDLISLRSCDGGSTELITQHLFKGALIFESILKTRYKRTNNGQKIKTLGGFHLNGEYISKYPKLKGMSSFSFKCLVGIIKRTKYKNSLPNSFKTTARIRNMTGHNLNWDDIFNNPNNYTLLYRKIINSIFYVIAEEFNCKST